MCRSRGEGRQGVRTPPPPLEIHKIIGFLNNTDPDLLKITKLRSQHSMLGHHLLANRCIWILLPASNQKTRGPWVAHLRMTDLISGVKPLFCLFVCFCCFTSQVNSYGHCGTVSSPIHTFSWAGLNKRFTSNSCTYFRL